MPCLAEMRRTKGGLRGERDEAVLGIDSAANAEPQCWKCQGERVLLNMVQKKAFPGAKLEDVERSGSCG